MNQGIPLAGSKGSRGRPAYTSNLNQNLFEPLAPDVEKSFLAGDGNEIIGGPDNPAKMRAIHSSSALSVNVFQYWEKNGQPGIIAAACGFCRKGSNTAQRIVFEEKYPVNGRFSFSPNIDVVFHNEETSRFKRFAVECKFSEPYGAQRHGGLKPEYLKLERIWDDIPAIHELAKTISPDDNRFVYLHAAQLVKHILGLKAKVGKTGFRLLYLWYDVLGQEGAAHWKEIENFTKVARADDLNFHALSYQKLIFRLASEFRQGHEEYISYLTGRYL